MVCIPPGMISHEINTEFLAYLKLRYYDDIVCKGLRRHGVVQWKQVFDLGDLDSTPSCTTELLDGLGQVTSPPCASFWAGGARQPWKTVHLEE